MSARPAEIRIATILLWSVLPVGLLVSAVNWLGVQQVHDRLPSTPPEANADAVGPAIDQFAAFGSRRTLVIAAWYVLAALICSVLAWVVRRGDLRRPAAVMLPAGALVVVYALGCWWVYNHDPVIDFRSHVLNVPIAVGDTSPWNTEKVAPAWYRPALGWSLTLSVAAQLAAVVLLTRARALTWMGRPAALHGDGVDAGTRRAGWLLVSALGFLALYVVVNAIAIQVAASSATNKELVDEGHGAHLLNLVDAAILAVWAAPLAICGALLLKRRARPGALATIGALTPVCLLTMWYLVKDNPVTWASYDDYDPLFDRQPVWHQPALYGVLAGAVLCQVTALRILASRGVRTKSGDRDSAEN